MLTKNDLIKKVAELSAELEKTKEELAKVNAEMKEIKRYKESEHTKGFTQGICFCCGKTITNPIYPEFNYLCEKCLAEGSRDANAEGLPVYTKEQLERMNRKK